MNTLYTLFATCPRGLETVLSQELGSLGCTDVQAFDGGVSCRGGLEQAYAANLRTAGVEVTAKRYDGMVHGFAWTLGATPSGAVLIDDLAAAFGAALAGAR